MHVKPSAVSVSQMMTWENAVCSTCYWVLAKKIKLTGFVNKYFSRASIARPLPTPQSILHTAP